jgi:hypothetical protein
MARDRQCTGDTGGRQPERIYPSGSPEDHSAEGRRKVPICGNIFTQLRFVGRTGVRHKNERPAGHWPVFSLSGAFRYAAALVWVCGSALVSLLR